MKKILIVDDEESFLLSLRDALKVHQDRFEVVTAGNGRVAVDLLVQTPIDLLVTDLRMPEMNGFELLAWISRHRPQLPVIAMSAFGTPEIEDRLRRMDALQFIEKPVDLHVLEGAIFNGLKALEKSYIRGISLANFLQLMNLERKTCTLKIVSAAGVAHLFVADGEIIDAEFGELSGRSAALAVVCWDDAEIEMDGINRRRGNLVEMPLKHLLLEAFRLKDEHSAQAQGSQQAWTGPAANAGALDEGGAIDMSEALAETLKGISDIRGFALFDELGRRLTPVASSDDGLPSERLGHALIRMFQAAEPLGNPGALCLRCDGSVLIGTRTNNKNLLVLICDPACRVDAVIAQLKVADGEVAGRGIRTRRGDGDS